MSKLFPRIVAVLLLPCMLIEPATGLGSAEFIDGHGGWRMSSAFTTQALASVDVAAGAAPINLKSRTGFLNQVRRVSPDLRADMTDDLTADVDADFVINNDQGILLLGPSGVGKSLLAHALVRAGAAYGGSEKIALHRSGSGSDLIGEVHPEQVQIPLKPRYRDSRGSLRRQNTGIFPVLRSAPVRVLVFPEPSNAVSIAHSTQRYSSLRMAFDHDLKLAAYPSLNPDLFEGCVVLKVTFPSNPTPDELRPVVEAILNLTSPYAVPAAKDLPPLRRSSRSGGKGGARHLRVIDNLLSHIDSLLGILKDRRRMTDAFTLLRLIDKSMSAMQGSKPEFRMTYYSFQVLHQSLRHNYSDEARRMMDVALRSLNQQLLRHRQALIGAA